MEHIMNLTGFVFMSLGLFMDIIGCIGLVRFPDVYNRLQTSTKCITFGTCSILFGTFLITGLNAAGMKCLICMLFIVLTAPVAAHAIARGSHRSGVKLGAGSVVDHYKDDEEGEK